MTALQIITRRWQGRAAALPLLTIAAVAATIVWGGFMAGTRAGHAYGTFPLIHGELVPPGAWTAALGWRNPFENLLTVQLVHRGLAFLALALAALWWWRGRRALGPRRGRLHAVLLLALAQVGLGAATVMLAVPLPLALAHQAGGVALLAACLLAAHAPAVSRESA